MKINPPHFIEFNSFGNEEIGFLTVAENHKNVPFDIKRVYWTYKFEEGIIRGHHAHYKTHQILIAVTGIIEVKTHFPREKEHVFLLDNPNKGLYLPPFSWHTMRYTSNAVQVVLASSVFHEEDYIRDYNHFTTLDF